MPLLTRAVDSDFSGGGTPPPQSWFDNLRTLGYEGFITTTHTFWSGNPVPNQNANTSLQRALNAGLWIAAYARPVHLWEDGMQVLNPGIRHSLKFFTLDVEDEPGGPYPILRDHVDGVKSYGVRPVVYSGSGLWSNVMGSSDEFSDVPLHDFAGDLPDDVWPDRIDEEPVSIYGGWNTPQTMRVGWQVRMQNNPPVIDGIGVDDNVFTREFIFGEEPPRVEAGYVGSFQTAAWTDWITAYPAAASEPGDDFLLTLSSNDSASVSGNLDDWDLLKRSELGSGTVLETYAYIGVDQVPEPVELVFEGAHWHSATMTTWRGYGVVDWGGVSDSGVYELDSPVLSIDTEVEGLVVHTGFHWSAVETSWTGNLEPVTDNQRGVSVVYDEVPEPEMDQTDVPTEVYGAVNESTGRMALHSVLLIRPVPQPEPHPTATVALFGGTILLTGDLHRVDSDGSITVDNVQLSVEP